MRAGCGLGNDYFKSDPLNVQLLSYLGQVNPASITEFFDERKEAEALFDQAV